MGKKESEVYNPCVPSPWGLEGSSPDVLPPQILVHSHLPRLGCLERELCFKTGEAILKSHVLPKARRGQHNNWAGSSFPLVFSHYVPPAMNQAQAVVWHSS